jgi:hypothetical protein
MTDDLPSEYRHLAGPLFVALAALAYNALALRVGRPSISAGVRWVARRAYGPEFTGAVVGMLLFHWFAKDPEKVVS